MIFKYFVAGIEASLKPIEVGTSYREERWINDELVSTLETIVPALAIEPINIVVSGVSGSLMHASNFSKITCLEMDNLLVSGTLNIPDRTFAMPLRRDDGRLILFPVNVFNGAFEAVLNFPTSGQYRYTDEEANIDLPEGTFTIAPIKIDVLRKVL